MRMTRASLFAGAVLITAASLMSASCNSPQNRADGGNENSDAKGESTTVDTINADTSDVTGVDHAGSDGTDAAIGPLDVGLCARCSISIVSVAGRQMAYDPNRRRLYVVVAATAPAYANSLTIVDPEAATDSAAVLSSVAVGPDPDQVAVADDGSAAWVGIPSLSSVRGVDVTSSPPVVGPMHELPETIRKTRYKALSIVPIAGAARSIGISVEEGGFFVLDEGVPRAMSVTRTLTVASYLISGTSSHLFASSLSNVGILSLSSAGVTNQWFLGLVDPESIYPPWVGIAVHVSGRLYFSHGQVLDVTNPTEPLQEGRFAFEGMVAARDPKRLLMLSTFATRRAPILRLLDTETFTQIASIELPGQIVSGRSQLTNFLYVGADAVAFLRYEAVGLLYSAHVLIVRSPIINL